MPMLLLLAASPALAGVLLNEVLYNPDGSDGGAEFVELCNNGSTTVDLSGYVIESAGTSWGASYVLPEGASIAPGEYLLIGAGSAQYAIEFDPNLQNGGSATDGVRLVSGTGTVMDTLLYDEPNDNGLLDDEDNAGTAPAPEASEGSSLGRWPDCMDTEDASFDFHEYDAPSPGAANPEAGGDTGGDTGDTGGGTADCTGSGSVKLNEMSYSTDMEWVELYNAGSSAVNLGDWAIEAGSTGGEFSKSWTIPAGTTLEPGAYFLMASPGAKLAADVTEDMDFGNASSGADALRVACNGAGVDTVVYGSADGEWMEDSGEEATNLVGKISEGQSIARKNNGLDTDVSGVDFTVTDAPTPGEANPETVCEPDGAVRLNEFVYDPDGTDDGYEWVELYNPGGTALALDGYVLITATSADDETGAWSGDDLTFPPGTSIGPGEFLVVGGAEVDGVDIEVPDGWSIGNGSDGDGIRLYDCVGAPIDTVLYGDPMASGLTDDVGGIDVVAPVASNSGQSLGRTSDGVDTNAVADWEVFATATPGEPNIAPEDTGGDDPKTGCGRSSRPEVEHPTGGCAVAPPAGGLAALLAGFVLLRRRR